ncbi:phage tail protein [Kistimonas scapharcae]|uniref:Phage tail protein n=1 Tax=Kistimonas scapharcae TaxID=1036133 RepID=A0ABP8VAX0_9GAMM
MSQPALNRDVRKLARKLSDISKRAVTKSDYAALRKTAGQIKTRVVKDVAGEAKIPQKHIRKRIYTKVKISRDQRIGRITGYRRNIPAISLGTVSTARTRKGQVRGIKAGGRTYPDAFVNKIRKTGQWQIMRRKGAKRYPVEVIVVKIAPFVDRYLPRRAAEIMRQKYPALLEHELKYRLQKYADKS